VVGRQTPHGDSLTIIDSDLLRWVKSRIPPAARGAARARLERVNRPRWGNLRRFEPFSDYYGFERGTPVDRFYIERFLAGHAGDIRGRVLEVGHARYARAFSSPREVEIVDNDEMNSQATIVADLAVRASLPSNRFDCFILAQTLQLVEDLDVVLENAWQSLARGGVLLITMPGITRADPELARVDRWRVTPTGLDTLLARSCLDAPREVVGYGNLISAVAFLMGLAAEELEESELTATNPHFTVSVCARVKKG
jgi:SAM-dependent methyltransferase